MSDALPPVVLPSEPGSPVGLLRNPITVVGALLTTISVLLFLGVLLLEAFGPTVHVTPYLGILFFIFTRFFVDQGVRRHGPMPDMIPPCA